MLPLGAAPLLAMRKAGNVPDGSVWVSYGNFSETGWHLYGDTLSLPELVVRFDDPIDRLDFRCLVKLDVTLYLARYDDNAALLFARLQDYAAEIVMLSPDFDEDLGMWWLPRYGVIAYERRGIVSRYTAAKESCIHSRNKAERDIAHAEEMRLLGENPWLRC
jgi:hypothetical protein